MENSNVVSTMENTDKNISRLPVDSGNWLEAYFDPVASLYTFSQCMVLSAITDDGENKLVVADLGDGTTSMKLKVFKGTAMIQENAIIDLPTAVASFFMDEMEPKVSAIAVASGPSIYIFKNMKPYFKFTLPSMNLNILEEEAWSNAKEGKLDCRGLHAAFSNLRDEGINLSARSMKYLQCSGENLEAFYEQYKDIPLKNLSSITCLSTLKKTYDEPNALSCLIVGTENERIYILDPAAFTILTTITLPSVPVFMRANGVHDVEFGITVVCRNAHIYHFKRGMKEVTDAGIALTSQCVGLLPYGRNLVVGGMDDTLTCYSVKGKRLWSVKMPSAITTMELLSNPKEGLCMIMVALTDSTIRIYKDNHVTDIIQTPDVVAGFIYGRYGREESCLIFITTSGSITFKLLKRSAIFKEIDSASGPPACQFSRLNIPKKTNLFVEQTLRERENAVGIHRQFMHDLYRMRLKCADNFLESIETKMNPITVNKQDPLQLTAHVHGIGPTFKLTVSITNTSMTAASRNLYVTFGYDASVYKVQRGYIEVPYLVPSVVYNLVTFVECLNTKSGIADVIKVFVCKKSADSPIVTGIINMPVSEGAMISA